jgi:hypothetical protein
MDHISKSGHNPLNICCGHDLIFILSFCLRKLWGTNNTNEVSPDIIDKGLRLAYEQMYFSSTQLYKAIEEWQINNGINLLHVTSDNTFQPIADNAYFVADTFIKKNEIPLSST